MLEEYQIPVSKPVLAKNQDEAADIAKKIGYPVVMKIQSNDITHKTDVGGVKLNVKTSKEVKEMYGQIVKNVKKAEPKSKIDGITIQPMVSSDGYELIIGSKKDPTFGSVILFGMGGVSVELFKDRAIGLPPLNDTLAKRLIEGTKVYELLKGFRGKKAANINLLKEILVRFSGLIVDFPEIKEIDINPLIIDTKKAFALDARIILDQEAISSGYTGKHENLVIGPYPTEYIEKIDVNGKEVTLRPIKPEDEPLHKDMFMSLSEETIRFRFLKAIKELSHAELVRFCYIDYDREITLVAIANENKKKSMVGICMLTGDPDNESAEFAIMLRDKWQGKGLGEKMMDSSISMAKTKGWKTIYAGLLPTNLKMINLFRKKGFELEKAESKDMYYVRKNICSIQ